MTATEPAGKIIFDALRTVVDPEMGCNIIDLGLIYSVAFNAGKVVVKMTLTTPGCPMHESIAQGVRNALLAIDGTAEADVEIVWDPPWNPAMMTDAGRVATGVC